MSRVVSVTLFPPLPLDERLKSVGAGGFAGNDATSAKVVVVASVDCSASKHDLVSDSARSQDAVLLDLVARMLDRPLLLACLCLFRWLASICSFPPAMALLVLCAPRPAVTAQRVSL